MSDAYTRSPGCRRELMVIHLEIDCAKKKPEIVQQLLDNTAASGVRIVRATVDESEAEPTPYTWDYRKPHPVERLVLGATPAPKTPRATPKPDQAPAAAAPAFDLSALGLPPGV